jgi:hypothetical protein
MLCTWGPIGSCAARWSIRGADHNRGRPARDGDNPSTVPDQWRYLAATSPIPTFFTASIQGPWTPLAHSSQPAVKYRPEAMREQQ